MTSLPSGRGARATADRTWATRLEGWIAWNHEEVETAIRRVKPVDFAARLSTTAPSIAFHAWHVGRWVDRHAATMPVWLDGAAADPEVWIARDFVRRWGLDGLDLGNYGGTGAGLDDMASARLALPDSDEVLEYVLASFRGFETALGRIDGDRALERTVVDLYGERSTVGDVLMNHLSHADRHLGMIEALTGVFGERGTVTE